jgi:hypothetical protein
MTMISTPAISADHADRNKTVAAAAATKLSKDRQAFARGLRTTLSTADAMRHAFYESKQELLRQRSEMLFQVSHFEEAITWNRGVIGPAEHQRLAAMKAELADKAAEIADLDAEVARIPGAYNPASIDAWLASNAGKAFRPVPAQIKLAKNQTLEEALTETRKQFLATTAEAIAIESADLPASESYARAKAEIDRIAGKAAPVFGGVRRTQTVDGERIRFGNIIWPVVYSGNGDGAARPDAFALLVYLHRDQLLAAAKEELRKLDTGSAVPLKERHAIVGEVRERARTLEFIEGAIIRRMTAEGAKVQIRADMDVGALLGVEAVNAPAAKAEAEREPGETPESRARTLKRAQLRDPKYRPPAKRATPQTSDGADPNDFG